MKRKPTKYKQMYFADTLLLWYRLPACTDKMPGARKPVPLFGSTFLFALTYTQAQLRLLVISLLCMICAAPVFSQNVGKRFPPEKRIITDKNTGVEIIALTTSPANDSKIYQTHPQWTADGEYIVFRSDRGEDGRTHNFAVAMTTGNIVQLTAGEDRGLNLSRKQNLAYHFRENRLVELDLGALLSDSEKDALKTPDTYERVAATLPSGLTESGGFGLDAHEQQAYVAVRVAEEKSEIYSIDLASGEVKKILEVPFRANHLQTNPYVPGEIMYCYETGGDAPQRIWFVRGDGSGNRPLYKETPEEWVTHEVFLDKDHILFNLMGHEARLRTKPTGIVSLNLRNNEVKVHDQAEDGGYWHCDGTSDGKWAVGDTFDGKLYRLNLEEGTIQLLTTGHRPKSDNPFTNEPHSHHSISPDGQWVLFNSGMLGNSDLMMVPLHPEEIREVETGK